MIEAAGYVGEAPVKRVANRSAAVVDDLQRDLVRVQLHDRMVCIDERT